MVEKPTRRGHRDVSRVKGAPGDRHGRLLDEHIDPPMHELTVELPGGAWVYGDTSYTSAPAEAVIRAGGWGVIGHLAIAILLIG